MAVGQAGWIRCGKLRLRGSGQGEKQVKQIEVSWC